MKSFSKFSYAFTFACLLALFVSPTLAAPVAIKVDISGAVGLFTSMELNSSGYPVISYYDGTNNDLKLAVCNDAICTSKTLTTVDSIGDVGYYSSLKLNSLGNPVISYYDITKRTLKVAVCNDSTCTTKTITTIDNTGDEQFYDGNYTSLALNINGNPVISYNDASNHSLKVATCDDPTCTSKILTIVDYYGNYASLALNNSGNPVISYRSLGHSLNIAICDDATCTNKTTTTIDSSVYSKWAWGSYTSLVLNNNGFPVISYWTNSLGTLNLAVCNDAACTNKIITTVDNSEYVGQYTSLVLNSNGNPVISYFDGHNGDLKVAVCADSTCTSKTISVMDNIGVVGLYNSLELNSGDKPVISYFDSTNADLKVVVATDAPILSKIVRADRNPNIGPIINFSITFSEPVTGVDSDDFVLTTNGVTGSSITGVNGSGDTYKVTVDIGVGTGTIRLDLNDNDSILDESSNPLGSPGIINGDFTTGQAFTIVLPPYPDSIVVNSNDDDAFTSMCGLREAIINANNDDQSGSLACAPGFGTDTITFAENYTITLAGQELPLITSTIIIKGNGASNTIIQANANPNTATNRVFEITSNGELTLDNLTLQNGNCNDVCSTGGGIFNNEGILTITNSVLGSNSAWNGGGAIYNYKGTLDIANSTFSDNAGLSGYIGNYGGGIYNYKGTLTVTNSTFAENVAASGGAINNMEGSLSIMNSSFIDNSGTSGGGAITSDGTLFITDSTFSGNSSKAGGGGISSNSNLTIKNSTFAGNVTDQSGGGILDFTYSPLSVPVSITNSTFSDNIAASNGGGIYSNNLIVANSTFSGNTANFGGGIRSSGTTTLYNTIVANSAGTNGSSGTNCGGTIIADGYNLDTDGTCGNANTRTLAQINLGSLADNGGPTQTMAIGEGSVAVNAGDNSICDDDPGPNNLDQRGITRPTPGNASCDVGAYEYEDNIAPIVKSISRTTPLPRQPVAVDFRVTFTDFVTGVDVTDFALVTTDITGATILEVSGSDNIYNVKVETGVGNGTIRLDLIDDDTVTDGFGNELGGNGTNNGNLIGEIYRIVKTPAAAPKLTAPAQRSNLSNPTPTFIWTTIRDATSYEIFIATDAAFNNIAVTDSISAPTYTPATSIPDGQYYWRVRAYNLPALPGNLSAPRSFTIDTTGPSAPTLSFPTNGAFTSRAPTFKWSPASTATAYEFQYDDDAGFANPNYTVAVRGTSRKPPSMPIGNYFWRVRAKDAAGNWGDWSTPFTINIVR